MKYLNIKFFLKNNMIYNGKMNIVADNVYANGIYAGFNKDGFTKKKDDSTNKQYRL